MRYLCGTILVFSQALILAPCQAQVVSESDKPAPPSISLETAPSNNTTLPIPPNNTQQEEVIASDTNKSSPAVTSEPSSRIPISSRIYSHPGMQQ